MLRTLRFNGGTWAYRWLFSTTTRETTTHTRVRCLNNCSHSMVYRGLRSPSPQECDGILVSHDATKFSSSADVVLTKKKVGRIYSPGTLVTPSRLKVWELRRSRTWIDIRVGLKMSKNFQHFLNLKTVCKWWGPDFFTIVKYFYPEPKRSIFFLPSLKTDMNIRWENISSSFYKLRRQQ